MTFKFWRVGCGDAITVSFEDSTGVPRNIFIDGGYLRTYKKSIKRELLGIVSDGLNVDLWIVTHTDRDHIGGVEAFLKDPEIENKGKLVSEYWFNWSSYMFLPLQSRISISQGIRLRDFLATTGKLRNSDIIAPNKVVYWYDLELTVLSPDKERLDKSKKDWSLAEVRTKISSEASDHTIPIEELVRQAFKEDSDPFNGGSIGILLQRNKRRILLLADSFPSVIIHSLKSLGYSSRNKLKVDYVKLSHHGSKRNFNPALLELIDCSRFIILANGLTHSLPDKWTLAQIVMSPARSGEIIHFFF